MPAPASNPNGPIVNPRLDQCDVFALITAERTYQDRKWGSLTDHPHEVGAWLLVMKGKLDAAIAHWQTTPHDRPALSNLIKAVAVGVACLEQHAGELLAKQIADMDFVKTNAGYMSPGLWSECNWPVLEAIRQRIKDKEKANNAAPKGG